jgi:hypothetical protein
MDKSAEGSTYYFNNVRSVIVILVVVLHAALAYCANSNAWWIVVNVDKTIIADIISGILDMYLMPILFFISGYFTLSSFKRGTKREFLLKKAKTLLLPWFLGIVILNPFLVFMISFTRGAASDSFLMYAVRYYSNFLEVPLNIVQDRTKDPYFFSQYHFWYISLLFVFFVAFTLFYDMYERLQKSGLIKSSGRWRNTGYGYVILIFLSSLAYFFMYTVFGDSWFVISLIQFQISRILPYCFIFVFGIIASGTEAKPANPRRPFTILVSVAALSVASLAVYRRVLSNPDLTLTLIYSFIRYTLCTLGLISVLEIGRRFFNRNTRLNDFMNYYSFGCYILHLDVVIAYTYILSRNSALDPIISMGLVIVLSVFTSYAVSVMYTNLLRRIIPRSPFSRPRNRPSPDPCRTPSLAPQVSVAAPPSTDRSRP